MSIRSRVIWPSRFSADDGSDTAFSRRKSQHRNSQTDFAHIAVNLGGEAKVDPLDIFISPGCLTGGCDQAGTTSTRLS
jgi:hypothetical protein